MYKYYSELENPDEFKIYMSDDSFRSNYHNVGIKNVDLEFYEKYSELFLMINYLNNLIIPEITQKSQNDFFMKHGEFLMNPSDNENYSYIRELGNKPVLDIYELIDYLRFYSQYMNFYEFVFPDMEDFFKKIDNLLRSALNYISRKNNLILPSKECIEIKYPNAWFITPGGYLYNTGGEHGHKEGNLIYAYDDICSRLNDNLSGTIMVLRKKGEGKEKSSTPSKRVPNVSNREKIKQIINNGYVLLSDYRNYSNYPYTIKQIVTPESIDKVSYQKNSITLVAGYLSAQESLYRAYARLNGSPKIKEHAYKVGKLCNGELSDILVRFAGFSKIESQRKNTICTSSLYGMREFKEYLDRGWDLDILPGIVYDKYLDEVSDVDLSSIFIKKHLDSELENYHGKGKVLINHCTYK